MQFLYQLDLRGEPVMEDLSEFLTSATSDPEILEFSLRLVTGTKDLRPELDETLTKVARNWDLRRMATLDRNVLRMAIFELLYCDDIPPKVSINEAIDIGKKYSTANSGAFINGILDRVKNEFVSPEKLRRGPSPRGGRPGGRAPREGKPDKKLGVEPSAP